MTGTDRAAVLTWVAGQLSWERRLRQLEATATADEKPPVVADAVDLVSEQVRASGHRRRAGSHAPAH